MKTFALLPGLAALSLLDPTFAFAQEPEGGRKVRIDITRTENGTSSRITREFDMTDEQALQDVLKELGVIDEINLIGEGENLVIDMRRMSDGGMLDDMSMALSMLDGADAELPEPRAYLGVYYGNYNANACDDKSKRPPIKTGCCLTSVIDDAPASKAGLQDGDVVVKMNDRTISSGSDLVAELRDHKPSDVLDVTYYRGKDKRNTKVTLGEQEDEEAYTIDVRGSEDMDWSAYFNDNWVEEERGAFLGITGGSSEEDVTGVRVGEVFEGSAAERMGLKQGDLIEQLNGAPVDDFSELAERISTMKPGEDVSLQVNRAGTSVELSGTLGMEDGPRNVFVMPNPAFAPPIPFTMTIPPMPTMPELGHEEMSAEDRAEYERSLAEYERDVAEYHRDLAEQARDMREYALDRDAYRREMDELRREMDQLRRDLRGDLTREVRVSIRSMELSPEEAALLKDKGVPNIDKPLGWKDLRIAPNPSGGEFLIAFQVPERGDLSVDVHNVTGERVYHETITGFKGSYERMLDLSDLPAGPYFLVIGQGDATEARKLVKQ